MPELASDVCAGGRQRSHNSLAVPRMPFGNQMVVNTKRPPRRNGQYGARKPVVKVVLAKLTMTAPRAAPASVPRPPTATQITTSMELPGVNSLGLMMPTWGT